MLEFCLRKERHSIFLFKITFRIKYSNLLNNKNVDMSEWKELAQSQQNINHSAALAQLNYPTIPKRRAKGHRHLLLKYLFVEIGMIE
jgi:hypothetical protein